MRRDVKALAFSRPPEKYFPWLSTVGGDTVGEGGGGGNFFPAENRTKFSSAASPPSKKKPGPGGIQIGGGMGIEGELICLKSFARL